MVLSREDQYLMEFEQLKMYLNLLNLRIVQVFSLQLILRKHLNHLNHSFLYKILKKIQLRSAIYKVDQNLLH